MCEPQKLVSCVMRMRSSWMMRILCSREAHLAVPALEHDLLPFLVPLPGPSELEGAQSEERPHAPAPAWRAAPAQTSRRRRPYPLRRRRWRRRHWRRRRRRRRRRPRHVASGPLSATPASHLAVAICTRPNEGAESASSAGPGTGNGLGPLDSRRHRLREACPRLRLLVGLAGDLLNEGVEGALRLLALQPLARRRERLAV